MRRPQYAKSSQTSQVPVHTVYVGSGTRFLTIMAQFSRALPGIFRTLNRLRLQKSYQTLQKMRFVERLEKGTTLFDYDKSTDTLSIYPLAFQAHNRIDWVVYAGLGSRFYQREMSSVAKNQWMRKQVVPKRATIDRLQDLFDKGPVRSNFKDYLKEFNEATDRLVVIHILNALIKNSVRPSGIKTLRLDKFPPTSDFVRRLKPYSLKPLLSAYVGKTWGIDKYEFAFAEYSIRGGKFPCSELSVEDALRTLFHGVTFNR